MDAQTILPIGKLPPELLEKIIANAPIDDPRVILGPGIGLDCAVLDAGASLWVLKTEPITFVTDAIGWYALQIAANDIATTGAAPRWYLATLLLPERRTTPALVEAISAQANQACRELGVSIIGGHTEITHGLDRPIMVGTLIGEVAREKLVTPRGSQPGDCVLLTKGVPVEATAILAREFPRRLEGVFTPQEIQQAQNFLYAPGVSILPDARIAQSAGRVTAMHDPTEGGLASALWEMAQACGHTFTLDRTAVRIPELSARICALFHLDPLATIASGALLFTAPREDAPQITRALEAAGIACMQIGSVEPGPPAVHTIDGPARELLPRPARDEITKVYE
jgi:hydrogenase maturation factor